MKVQKQEILKRLEQAYQGAVPALHFANPFELLVATILSAQCTDARVNQVTKYLFLKYKNARELAAADFEELCEDIHSCGCYRVKAKNLMGMAKILEEKYGGEVPADMDKLTELPGVGRKTANVVLSNAFGIPGFAVDTHVFRVSNRLGLAQAVMEDPELLILDEPMNGLDKSGVAEMRELFLKLKSQGKTILIASHNPEDTRILCDTLHEMDGGIMTEREVLR